MTRLPPRARIDIAAPLDLVWSVMLDVERYPERVTALRPPYDDQGTGRGTRFQHLSQAPGGPTHYDTHEEFSGPLVGLAGPGRVADGFRRHAEALKSRSERLHADQRR